jgi:hypothetical protein
MAVALTGHIENHLVSGTEHTTATITPSGPDRCVTLDFRCANASMAETPTVLFGGSPMTQIGDGASDSSAGGLRSFRILNPPESAAAAVITFSNPTSLGYSLRAWSGVHTTAPIGDTDETNSGVGPDIDLTLSSAVGNMVADVVTGAAPFSSSDQTVDSEMTDGANYVARASHAAGASSVPIGHTLSGAASFAHHAYELIASVATTRVPTGIRVLADLQRPVIVGNF